MVCFQMKLKTYAPCEQSPLVSELAAVVYWRNQQSETGSSEMYAVVYLSARRIHPGIVSGTFYTGFGAVFFFFL